MRKIRFTEHQIIAVLKSVEAGRTVKDVCREAAIWGSTPEPQIFPLPECFSTNRRKYCSPVSGESYFI